MKLGVVTYDNQVNISCPKERGIPLPSKVMEFYIEHFRPYTIVETELLGAKCYQAKLHITEEQISEKGLNGQKILEKLLKNFQEKGVQIVVPPIQSSLPMGILPLSDGKAVKGFYVMEAITKFLSIQKRDLKNTRVVLVDGGNVLTQLILDRIYPNVNFLSILSDRQEDFEHKVQEIYEDCGLNVYLFSNGKNTAMAEADIILNCGCEMQNYDYTIQRGAFYFDIAQNKRKLHRLMVRRNDIFLADGILLRKEKHPYTDKEVEGAAYVNKEDFQSFLSSSYDPQESQNAENSLKEDQLQFLGFTCLGKRVRP